MRILFDMGVYDLRNKGNVALLQVAVERIRARWRDASLNVITSAPNLLRLYCPHAFPISPDQQFDWRARVGLVDRIVRRLPRPLLRGALELRDALWHRVPALGGLLTRRAAQPAPTLIIFEQKNPAAERNRAHIDLVNGFDLVIGTGSQYLSDACRDDALCVLDRLEAAHRLGISTALVGQGLGPFDDAELRARVQAVLPLVDLIFVRDDASAALLRAMPGVDPARVMFTGDDAIEMTWRAHTLRAARGNLIGVNVRVAHYTQVRSASIETLRAVLRAATCQRKTHLLALPISHSIHELDARAIQQLCAGIKTESAHASQFETPDDIIKKVGRCRVVITGAFHPAVFALAQGIPAIGLVKSPMYIGKFAGLVEQFGAGCQIVHLDDAQLEAKLTDALESAWNVRDDVRAQLLARAERQIELGQCAYQRLFDLVAAK